MRLVGVVIVCIVVGACGSTAAGTNVASSARTSGSVHTQSCDSAASPARTYDPTAPNPPTPSPGTAGSIAGSLSYPSEVIAPQLVYAVDIRGVAYGGASVETIWGQSSYVIEGLVPGTYRVFSVARGFGGIGSPACAEWGAVYSPAVACGLTVYCTDHSPLEVTVRAGQTTPGISPTDWYGNPGDGSFQAPPASIVPTNSFQATGGFFEIARDAANDYAKGRAPALLVDDLTSCPVNRACVVVGTEVDGSGAAYFVGLAGSNGFALNCGTYVYFAPGGGWHSLAWRCRQAGVFPAVGQTGSVVLGMGTKPTDCVNVRATAGLSGRVVGCILNGASVSLDSGPTYAPGANIDGLWWHVRGKGWMVDDFLSADR